MDGLGIAITTQVFSPGRQLQIDVITSNSNELAEKIIIIAPSRKNTWTTLR